MQGFDPLLELADASPEVCGDEAAAIRGEGNGVQARLLAGEFAPELRHAADGLLEREDGSGGRRPRHELHAHEELQDAERVDTVGLGTGEPGALEVFCGPRVDDHDPDARGAVQRKGEVEAVNARGFQADAGMGAAPGEQADDLAVPGGRVGEGLQGLGLAVAQERKNQFTGADINAGKDVAGLFHGWFWCLVVASGFPASCSCPRPTLSMQARGGGNAPTASDTLRRGQRSRGADLTNRVLAGQNPRHALRRLRPPEEVLILPNPTTA
jgi:hypothetical protein